MVRPTTLISDRIWEYIEITDGCWIWRGCHSKAGYAIMKHAGRTWRVNRLIWTLFRGVIPAGLVICHRCDNRSCVNFKRCLFLGTPADNNADMHAKGRGACGERHGMAKLHEADVIRIRKLWVPRKYPARRIAAAFGISERMVWLILKRENWASAREST